MIRVTYTHTAEDGAETTQTKSFTDPLFAAQCLTQIDLYENLRLDEWESDETSESLAVLRIRERRRS